MPRPYWSPARDEELRIHWDAGHSIDDIGILMETTRNAVVGRAWRLGLQPREPCIRRAYGPRPSEQLSATRTCTHPVGDPALGEYRFCGRPVKLGQQYCPIHRVQTQQDSVGWLNNGGGNA